MKNMNNKILLVALVIMVGVMAFLSWKVVSASNSGIGSAITLSTNPSPLGLGQTTFVIEVKDENGKPVDDATVTFDLNMATMNMGTQRGKAISQGSGRYSAVGRISMRGPWRVRTTVRMPDGSTVNKDFSVNVP
jgi:nitrogen fixation protein FixH